MADRLAEAHRLSQHRIGIETVRLVLATFPLLDPADPKGTGRSWVDATVPIVQAQRRRSARLAANYLSVARAQTLGVDVEPFIAVLEEDAPLAQLRTSLTVTGPVALLRNLGRGSTEKAINVAKVMATGAAMRLALDGGRHTITATVRADRRAKGYERITSATACDFCEMLAERGAVYGEDSVEFESHDHCSCSGVPVYE